MLLYDKSEIVLISGTDSEAWLVKWSFKFVDTFGAEGRWLVSTSSRHVWTLGRSFTRSDVALKYFKYDYFLNISCMEKIF